jgi:hypothetical protein
VLKVLEHDKLQEPLLLLLVFLLLLVHGRQMLLLHHWCWPAELMQPVLLRMRLLMLEDQDKARGCALLLHVQLQEKLLLLLPRT